jgi:murein DD-endopeptidase MepM/ murein hydrolase activator NlpD
LWYSSPLYIRPLLFWSIVSLIRYLFIVVDQKKHPIFGSHTILSVILVIFIISPYTVVHAGVVSSFAGKIKAVFSQDKQFDDQTLATSQTMELIKPIVFEDASLNGSDTEQNLEQDSLQVTSGPLRVSTEDIDFPGSDAISVYEVKKGDTIQDVAKLFDVSVNTIMWANNLKSKTITQGDTLIILPITGIKHTVKKGDTITSIAKKYKADEQDIATYNGLSIDATLTINDTVIVPDGEIAATVTQKPQTPKSKKPRILNSYSYTAPAGFLIRPIQGGRKTQGIHGHNGVDLANVPGTPVMASAAGRIIVAKTGGYNGGYGNMIIISHDNGIQTVYGHLRAVYVTPGMTVNQGQVIGELGNTGRSTGPHLHFEVRGAKNPF